MFLAVTKPHLTLLAILILVTSSCAMKNLLWEFMGADIKISAKALPVTGENHSDDTDLLALCLATQSHSSINEADFLPNLLVKAPLLLLLVAGFISSWTLVLLFTRKKLPPVFTIPNYRTRIPIYLQLGRLVYYG